MAVNENCDFNCSVYTQCPTQIMFRLVLSGTVPAGNHGICIQSLSWTGYLL